MPICMRDNQYYQIVCNIYIGFPEFILNPLASDGQLVSFEYLHGGFKGHAMLAQI